MTNELKPCPFAKLDEKHHIDVIETHPGYGCIYCRNCDFDFPSEESIPLDVLIERWNTRSELTCRIEKTVYATGICSSCGVEFNASVVTNDTPDYVTSARYCPNCGARVVSE